jgi:hypothetical protein
VLAASIKATRAHGGKGFTPMFDGVSLKNWKGGGGWWEVKDGILQAQVRGEALQEEQPTDLDRRSARRL